MSYKYKHIPVEEDVKKTVDKIKKLDGRPFNMIIKEMSIDFIKKHKLDVKI